MNSEGANEETLMPPEELAGAVRDFLSRLMREIEEKKSRMKQTAEEGSK